MEATRVRRCYLQRLLQPKAKENWRIRRHPIIHPNRDLRIILAVVCYSFSNPHMWTSFRKTVIGAWY